MTFRRPTPWLLLAWAALTAWCVWSFPPPVDVPAHAAQLETLVNLLRGDPAVSRIYTIKFPMGYGLPYWLFLPLALVSNGAVAIRVALWVALLLLPLSLLALARAFQRSEEVVLLSLPLAFNFSYWYGLLSGLFAQPLVFFTLALFEVALQKRRWSHLFWLNVLALATFLSHLVAFAVLLFLLGIRALMHRPRSVSLRLLALGVILPLIASSQKIGSMATRAVTAGPWPATEFAAAAHLNWFFKNYKPEGRLAAVGPLLVTAIFVIAWLARRKKEPAIPAALFFAMVALYCITPKTLSGIYLIHVRLPIFAGMLSLALVDWKSFALPFRVAMACLSIASLAETATFHWRFERAIDGLADVVRGPPPGNHAYLSLAGSTVLGSKIIYLEHLGQWMTGERGGVGHNFFADAEHHPVRFRPGAQLPSSIANARPEQIAFFDTVLVFGEGPLPSALTHWREIKRVKRWRRLERPTTAR